ncbi:hypothetical protein Poli38472_002996 [Pythium oligandrum]|uniref:Uncharacterized protein n=1 Tax=Pythium oligandrum TaxID=41045 RepID=A0A8K1C604_PYTOL|nr:hypothetical protein Poli38472_002996 [Pythium oligandrum]|eukprot:TMW57071.1 hypothetical protein Poli38472_002996 [Pythium oligandrum]
MLRRREWLQSRAVRRRCTPFQRRQSTQTTTAGLDSLIAYGERVLKTPEPSEKVRLTHEAYAQWLRGGLPIWSGDVWRSDPPPQPARSELPVLYAPKVMPSPKDMDAPIPVIMLHALAHIELGAIDNYWDTIVRFDPHKYKLPRPFYEDFLTVADDEARHFTMVDDRLRQLGSYYGDLPATLALLEHAANTTEALAARIAVVPLVQEARGLDSGERLVHKLQSVGDKASAKIVEQIVFEERNHVSCGIKWFQHLCGNVLPEGTDPVSYFHELVLHYFPDGLPGPFDIDARLAADMPPAWYQPLEAKTRHYKGTARDPTVSASSSSQRLAAFASGKKKIVLAGSVWPERTSSAAGVRSSDLIAIFQAHGYQVLCVSPSRLNEHTERLGQEHNVHCVQADANSDAFQKLLREVDPQIVVFDRFIAEEMYGWQAQKYAPQALRVLDLQDVHFLRRAREFLVKKRGVPFVDTLDVHTLPLESEKGDLEKHVIRELAAIHRSDLTLYVSDVERQALTQRFQIPDELLHRCDFFYPQSSKESLPGFDARRDIAFIGSFKHAPNVDAVEWLKQSILPVFRASGNAVTPPEIHVYGSYSQDSKRYAKLHDPTNGFHLKGFAPDVHETLQRYRLSVAPLRFGAGIKGKIADGWVNGTPCVSTAIGAEGMYLEAGGASTWGGYVADTPDAFARAMHTLYDEPSEWHRAQTTGFQISSTRYDWETNASSLMERLERARAEQETTRSHHWMGRILWSEKYRATEFMSRYIRLKNEKSSDA